MAFSGEQACNLEESSEALTTQMWWAEVIEPNGLLANMDVKYKS